MQEHLVSEHKPVVAKRPTVRPAQIPTPAPPKVDSFDTMQFPMKRKLLGGANIDIGDTIYHVEKCCITKITKYKGSADVDVEYIVTKRNWQFDKPM